MKTQMKRGWSWGLVLVCVALGAGCREEAAILMTPLGQITLATPNAAGQATQPAGRLAPSSMIHGSANADSPEARPGSAGETTAGPEPAPSQLANEDPGGKPPGPDLPPLSPGLQEIIKLSRAGIGEEIILAYIARSTNLYYVSSDEIVYLNDLGISSMVIAALIEKDTDPESQARKKEGAAVTPLPQEVVLSEPATNIYPGSAAKSNIVAVPKFPDNDLYALAQSDLQPEPPPEPVTVYQPAVSEQLPSQVSQFYSTLAPYGTWYEVPEYGYSWQPTVAVVNHYWRPYADHGCWLWSDHGWYWYSYYSWGWAPFHYGRWCSYPRLGWIWVPDRVWGPSWVSWRYTKYYGGWAPLPPHTHYVSGFGLYYNRHSVGLNFDFGLGYHHYTFIPLNRFCERKPYLYYSSHSHVRRLFEDSQIINHYGAGDNHAVMNFGIPLERISRVTRTKISRVQVREDAQNFSSMERRERLLDNGREPVVLRQPLSSRSFVGGREGQISRNESGASPAGITTQAPRFEGQSGPGPSRGSVPNVPPATGRAGSNPADSSGRPLVTRGRVEPASGQHGWAAASAIETKRPSLPSTPVPAAPAEHGLPRRNEMKDAPDTRPVSPGLQSSRGLSHTPRSDGRFQTETTRPEGSIIITPQGLTRIGQASGASESRGSAAPGAAPTLAPRLVPATPRVPSASLAPNREAGAQAAGTQSLRVHPAPSSETRSFRVYSGSQAAPVRTPPTARGVETSSPNSTPPAAVMPQLRPPFSRPQGVTPRGNSSSYPISPRQPPGEASWQSRMPAQRSTAITEGSSPFSRSSIQGRPAAAPAPRTFSVPNAVTPPSRPAAPAGRIFAPPASSRPRTVIPSPRAPQSRGQSSSASPRRGQSSGNARANGRGLQRFKR